MTRRSFVAAAAAAPSLFAAGGRPPLCIFSKHLAKLNYDQLGKAAREFGFDGVDLAVRPGGHVEPARVTEDLPKALAAIRAHGVEVPMITTGLLTPDDPAARPTLSAAAKGKVTYFKTGYWRYKKTGGAELLLTQVKQATHGLAAIGKEYGIQLGFHNHSGDYVGSAVWDTRFILEGTDPKWAGYYFDPGHATIEGGLHNWKLSTEIVLPRMKMVAIKDFVWAKKNGKWVVEWTPLGEGMVNWPEVFAAFARARYTGPLSLHLEYDTPDEHAAIARDLAFLKKQVSAAYST